MRNRLLVLITIVLVTVSAVIGMISKSGYTNITAKENGMNYFSVGLLDDELVENTVKFMEDENEGLESSNFILRVKAARDLEFMFMRTKQPVIVQEVYKGKGLKAGDEIEIISYTSLVYFENMSINMGFVNKMEPNEEYLIFLDKKADSLYEDDNVYATPENIMKPVFSYADRENVIAVPKSDENTYVPYTEVQKNEFFVTSQNSVDRLNLLKKKLFERYPA